MAARIYRPAKSATQSGSAKSRYWLLEFDRESAPEIEPLMGWTSSLDTKTQVKMRFATEEEAVACLETLVETSPEAAKVSPDKLLDTSFAAKLESEGFFDKVAKEGGK